MRESELQILEQYDIDVKNTRKVRDAVLCETKQGLFLMKEMKISEKRLSVLEWLGEYLRGQGYENVDWILKNKEGALHTVSEEGNRYFLKRWYSGKECDIYREREILDAVINMTRIHSLLRHISGLESEMPQITPAEDTRCELARHNRELKKVRSFMRERVGKGEFELTFLKYFDAMYAWAEAALDTLDNSGYETLREESRNNHVMIHGDYNYHNVLMTYGGVATTNFDHMQVNIQVTDFYYFLRKVMEKHEWDPRLGDKMIDCYQKYLPFQKGELEYIAVCLAYPEKFWKAANAYHRSRKSWIPAKNIEKLELVVQQTEQKKAFLENLFSFHL